MRGILLCGGQSRRMGQKKQWLPFDDRPLLFHTLETMYAVCEDVLVVANEAEDRQRLQERGIVAVPDLFPGQGPLAGLHAGLAGLAEEAVACLVGCDQPFLRPQVFRDMADFFEEDAALQAVVPREGDHLHPVCALYRGNVRPVAASCLEQGQNAMRHFLAKLEVCEVSTERWRTLVPSPFLNMNTPEDYHLACKLWKEGFGHDE